MTKVEIGDFRFKTQTELKNYIRELVASLKDEQGLCKSVKEKNEDAFRFLIELFHRHPDAERKLENMTDIEIDSHPLYHTSRFLIRKTDDSFMDISWTICVNMKTHTKYDNFAFCLRNCINEQIKDFRRKNDTDICSICDKYISGISEIDHIITFSTLKDDFVKKYDIILPEKYDEDGDTNLTCFLKDDMWIGEEFQKYHQEHATLRATCKKCNLAREHARRKGTINFVCEPPPKPTKKCLDCDRKIKDIFVRCFKCRERWMQEEKICLIEDG